MSEAPSALGRRVIVTGMAGSGKSSSRSRSPPRPACRSFILTSTSGSPAGFHRRRPSGARSNAACSRATRGSLTATTTRHSISGSNARTLLCFSTCPGGSAQDARSCAASGCRASCPKGVTIRPGCGCAMSGVWPSLSRENAGQSRSANTKSFRSTVSMWPFTCSDPSGRSGNSSTVWTPTTWKPTTLDRTLSDSPPDARLGVTPPRRQTLPDAALDEIDRGSISRTDYEGRAR